MKLTVQGAGKIQVQWDVNLTYEDMMRLQPHSTPNSQCTKQASGQAIPRQITCPTSPTRSRLRVAAFDFEKARDRIEHSSIWRALREKDIEVPSIGAQKKHYNLQRAIVHTDVKSKPL